MLPETPSPRWKPQSSRQWRRSSSPAARPSGSATPPAGGPKSLVDVAGRPLAAYQVGRLVARRRDARDLRLRRRPGRAVRAGAGRARRRRSSPPRSRSGSAAAAASRFAARERAGGRRRLRAERRRAVDVDFAALLERHRASGRAATITVARPKSQFGLVDVDDDDVVHGFEEARARPVLGQLRQLRAVAPRRSSGFPERGDHESTTFPELAAEGQLRAFRHEGLWLTVNTPKELRARRRARRRAPGMARVRASPEVSRRTRRTSLARSRGRSTSRRVDKPWGYELIWALTDIYCGKVLFVRAGHSLSLQFHREKDESWLVQSGRAKLELGERGRGRPRRRRWSAAGRRVPLQARARCTASPRSRTRRSSRSRRRSSTTWSGSRTPTAAPDPPDA